jgi:thiosulfate dehydrogenase [quinone] large subunit
MASTTTQSPDSATPEETQPSAQADPAPRGRSKQPVLQQASLFEAPRQGNLRFPDWLYRSHTASVLWLVVRVWLGYQWLNAGYQKIWGSERSAFWFSNGLGVKGFATAGVAGSATGKSGASYGWWAAFLHNFVIPNASWIGKLVSLGELLIGVALILGLLTGAVAVAGLTLNVIYMFTGSAGVNPMFAILSVLLILAWRNAGWYGLDRFVLGGTRMPRLADAGRRVSHRRVVAAPAPAPQ